MAQQSQTKNGVEKIDKGYGGLRISGVSELQEDYIELYVVDYELDDSEILMVGAFDFSKMVLKIFENDNAGKYIASAYTMYQDREFEESKPNMVFSQNTPVGEVEYTVEANFGYYRGGQE